MVYQKEKRLFYHLTNGKIYLIEKGFCDKNYFIRKEFLYEGKRFIFHKKLGKIDFVSVDIKKKK